MVWRYNIDVALTNVQFRYDSALKIEKNSTNEKLFRTFTRLLVGTITNLEPMKMGYLLNILYFDYDNVSNLVCNSIFDEEFPVQNL